MRQKFTQIHRLKTKADFAAVFVSKLKIRHSCYIVFYRLNSFSYPRLGVIVKKSIVRQATERNYIKRVVRESFRKNMSDLGGLDLVILLSNTYKSYHKRTLSEELSKIWVVFQQKLSLA